MVPLALFVLVCALGRASTSVIPRRYDEPTGVSKVVPPPIDQPALMARFIVNQADWTAISTISIRKDVPGYPVASLMALSDGPVGKGTGVPYMFMTPLDYAPKDLAVDNRATLMITLAQGSYCKDVGYDPLDPRCARILMTGRIVKVNPDSDEITVAKAAMFGRHPWLAHMPENHHFFLAKMEIETIAVLDAFGGPKFVTSADYYNPPTPTPKTLGQFDNTFDMKHLSEEFDNELPEAKFVYRVR